MTQARIMEAIAADLATSGVANVHELALKPEFSFVPVSMIATALEVDCVA